SILRLFDAQNGDAIWHSENLGGGGCQGILQLASGGRAMYIAIMSNGSILAFDAQTREEIWSLESGISNAAIAYIPHGEAGAELAVYAYGAGIQFFDLETLAPLRLIEDGLYNIGGLIQPSNGSIHDLIVHLDGAITIVDGISGAIRARSEKFGFPASRNIALFENPDGSTLIGSSSSVATFTHRLVGIGDSVFVNGFEPPSH